MPAEMTGWISALIPVPAISRQVCKRCRSTAGVSNWSIIGQLICRDNRRREEKWQNCMPGTAQRNTEPA